MSKTIILSIKYSEPDWQHTQALLNRHSCPVLYIDRKGTGSLAEAINRGVKELKGSSAKYIWIVTNVYFQLGDLLRLESQMDASGCAAIHPSFKSDHAFIRNGGFKELATPVPFVEFTAPIVRKEIIEQFPLDEDMPYWGHDLDWGHRVTNAGHTLGVDHAIQLQHAYIRNAMYTHSITEIRKRLRKETDAATTQKLVSLYGENWKQVLKYRS